MAVRTNFFRDIIDSMAAELIARRLAMKNATDAASDMVKDLSRVYNRTRQAAITAAVLIAILLLVVLRNVVDAALVFAPLVLAALLAGASTVVLDQPFNFANVIVLPLLFGLGVDSGIHLVLRAREEGKVNSLLMTSTASRPSRITTGHPVIPGVASFVADTNRRSSAGSTPSWSSASWRPQGPWPCSASRPSSRPRSPRPW